jgi:uncharacterized membrane protein
MSYDLGMLLFALVVGGLALYYFGLRAGAWAAGAALALSLVALFVPSWAPWIHLMLGLGGFAIWWIGRRRPRPPEAVRAAQMVRERAVRLVRWLRSNRE